VAEGQPERPAQRFQSPRRPLTGAPARTTRGRAATLAHHLSGLIAIVTQQA
jgi:hypothetical protein